MWEKARTMVTLALGVVVIWAVIWGMSAVAYGATATEVRVSAPVEVAPGGNFTATIDINQVANFDATDYDVSFNSTVLRLNNVTNGKINSTEIPVDIWHEIKPGTITIVQNVPGLSGVSGSGRLAVLSFRVIGAQGQSSSIILANGTLGNTLAQPISATWTGGTVRVVSVEPGGQQLPSAPPSPPSPPGTTPTAPGTTPTAPGTTPTVPGTTPTVPEATPIVPEEEAKKEELPPTPSSPPESGTTEAPDVAPAPPPSPPPAPSQPMNWPVLWSVIGGVAIVIGLIIFLQFRRRLY